MRTVEITYDVTVLADALFERGICGIVSILPDWAGQGVEAEAAVKALAEDFFAPPHWREHFDDADRADVLVRIHEPTALAGTFEVTLRRVTKAEASRTARM